MTAPLLLLAVLQAAPGTASLADVAFMAGHWVDASPDALSEEVWTEPAGDSMLGMWRYVGKGQVQIFEILTLKAEGRPGRAPTSTLRREARRQGGAGDPGRTPSRVQEVR